jgi:hypothetical protein
MKKMIRLAVMAASAAVSMQLTGCANLNMSVPQPTADNVVKLRAMNMAPVSLGAFKIAPAMAGSDASASMRGANSVQAPGGSFAQYLGESLKTELQAAGLLDPAASTVITGTLTNTDLNAAIGTGTAKLAARFVVTRDGAVKFDNELGVDSAWESSLIGGLAIPLAAQNYEGLYRKLVGKLLDDAAFRAAVTKQ